MFKIQEELFNCQTSKLYRTRYELHVTKFKDISIDNLTENFMFFLFEHKKKTQFLE